MSFIRPSSTPRWEPDALGDDHGLYVYGGVTEGLHYVPRDPHEWIEVAMRMLDQSDALSGATLDEVHEAYRDELLDSGRVERATGGKAGRFVEGAVAILDGTERVDDEQLDAVRQAYRTRLGLEADDD